MDSNYCVYKHTNKSNGMVYIGITNNIDRRWGKNGNGYLRDSFYFSRAIEKYGWDGFDHEVLIDSITESEAKELEKYYIAKYKSNASKYKNPQYGYNLTDGGDGASGYKHTKSGRAKISDALRGKYVGELSHRYGVKDSDEYIEKVRNGLRNYYATHKHVSCRAVLCVTDGIIFESITDAAKHYTTENDKYKCVWCAISDCCSGKRLDFHGKQFTFNLDGRMAEYVGYERTKTKVSEHGGSKHKVMCVETGIVYDSITDACKNAGINNTSSICAVLDRPLRTSGGFHWVTAS